MSEYINKELALDVKRRLYGRKKEREAARQTIIAKAVEYTQAKTPLSKDRVTYLVSHAIDIIREIYLNKSSKELRFLFAEFEDAIISSTAEEHKNQLAMIKELQESSQDEIVKSIKDEMQGQAILSIDKSIRLLEEGKIEGVEASLSTYFQAIRSMHPLQSDYKYEPVISGDKLRLQSVPLRHEAVEKYPPRIKCVATIRVENQNVSNFSSATIDYANRHQYPITINIKDAKKFLGDIVDPAQHEAEQLVGKNFVIKPVPFPAAFPCSIITNGNIEFEYILLRTQEILEDGSIIISNIEQTASPFRIKMRLHLEKQEVDFSISVLYASNKDLLKYNKFMQSIAAGAQLRIRLLSQGTDIISSTIMPFEFKNSFEQVDEEIAFLENLIILEEFFGTPINIEGDIFDEDLAIIQYICDLVNGNVYRGTWSTYDITQSITDDLKDKIGSWGDIVGDLKLEGTRSLRLFNQDYSIRVSRIYKKAIIQDLPKLKKKFEILDVNDTVNIRFVPQDASGTGTYEDIIIRE